MARLWRRLYNSWQVARAVRWGRAFERASRDEIDAYVERRLSALVQFAAERVPYYRDLFRREGIDPREIRIPRDLRRLPTLDKAMVGAEPERFMPEGTSLEGCVPIDTSGTTGRATTTWYDLPGLLERVGRTQRQRDKQRLLADPKLAGRPKMYICQPTGTPVKWERVYREQLLLPERRARSVVVSGFRPPEEILARIREVQPRVIATSGSMLEILVAYLRRYDPEAELPYVFTYSAEVLSPWVREALEQRHGAKVLSSYTAGEMGVMAYECEHRRLLHVAEDLVVLRVCDERGEDLVAGSGEVVATNLLNRQTVLINYRPGDRVDLTREQCPCGTALRSLARVDGRVSGLIVSPRGELLLASVVVGILRDLPGILRYQFVQEAVSEARLRLVLAPGATLSQLRPTLDAGFQKNLGPEVNVEYEVVEDIPVPPSGKLQLVVSKVPVPGGVEERGPEQHGSG